MNDQLTRDERLRLEALSQANHCIMGRGDHSTVMIVAQLFETYIRTGTNLADAEMNKQ